MPDNKHLTETGRYESFSQLRQWLRSNRTEIEKKAWLAAFRVADREEHGSQVFVNYVYSLLEAAREELQHLGLDKLTCEISPNFESEKLEKWCKQPTEKPLEIHLTLPGNWQFTVECRKESANLTAACRCYLRGLKTTYHYPQQQSDRKLPWVSVEQALGQSLVSEWLKSAIQTYIQEV